MPGYRRRDVTVETRTGSIPVTLHYPTAAGSHPGVVLYMDGPGIRPAIRAVADRLAGLGYAVALPDLFWRAGPYAPVDPRIVFADPVLKERHRAALMATATPANVMADTRDLLDAMAAWPQVAAGPVGVVGYCMGGRLALIAAATFPDAIGVAASFHGGGLADDRPESPHRLALRMTAEVYVGGAIDDPHFDAGAKARLERAFVDSGVVHQVETYPARHGWVPADTLAHDSAEAERHWRVLAALLARTLKAA